MTTAQAQNTAGMKLRCSKCEEVFTCPVQQKGILENKVIQCDQCGTSLKLSDEKKLRILNATKTIKGYSIAGGTALAVGLGLNAASFLGMIEQGTSLLGNGACILVGLLVVAGLRSATTELDLKVDEVTEIQEPVNAAV